MTETFVGARRLRELLTRHDITPRKDLGQNFVIDPNTVTKVIDLSGVGSTDRVVEIGAGAGSLTLPLAHKVEHVVAIEFDRRLVPILKEVVGGLGRVEIVQADALRIEFGSIQAGTLMGNLPYNIATTVVLRALESAPQINAMTVMTQREVGERLAAAPGSKIYGGSSVLVRYFAEAKVAGRVSRRAFYPVPNVDSVIVRVIRRPDRPDVPFERFAPIVKAAFSQRRKMVRNALSGLATASSAEAALAAAGVDRTARAEDIDFESFLAIAEALT